MVNITGKVLRITPLKEAGADENKKKVAADLIVADAFDYWRVSLRDDKTELADELREGDVLRIENARIVAEKRVCLLYTSPSPRDRTRSRMPSSA